MAGIDQVFAKPLSIQMIDTMRNILASDDAAIPIEPESVYHHSDSSFTLALLRLEQTCLALDNQWHTTNTIQPTSLQQLIWVVKETLLALQHQQTIPAH